MWILFIVGCFLRLADSTCPSGWVTHNQQCYHFSHDEENWTSAFTMCRILGGKLLEIEDTAEGNFISSQVKMYGRDYWIGLTDVDEEGTWVWMTSVTQSGYTNWSPGEPSGIFHSDIENCVDIRGTNGLWNDIACANQKFYICEKSDDIVLGCFLRFADSACPNGWVIHNQQCYHFSHDMEDWTGAFTMCRILGGKLLEIEDTAEGNFVSSQVKISGKDHWIGLTDVAEEGTWVWMTSFTQSSYTNWSPGEPSAIYHSNIENCVDIFGKSGLWNDGACADKKFYICEKPDETVDIVG